jgi:hypothetical protein
MGNGIRLKPTLQQSRLNVSHPLARGLQQAYLFNEGTGIKLTNTGLWGPNADAYQTGVARSWSKDPAVGISMCMEGKAISTSAFVLRTATSSLLPNYGANHSYAIRMIYRSTAETSNLWNTSATNIQIATSGKFNYRFSVTDHLSTSAMGGTSTDIQWYSWGIRHDQAAGASGGFIDLNGVQDNTYNASAIGSTVPADILNNTFGVQDFVGYIDYIYAWTRTLTQQEMAWVHADPFCMYQTSKRYFFVGLHPPAGGARSFGFIF